MSSFNLAGRIALVTGASSGLGEGFSRLLARAGAKVVLAARRTDKLEGVVADIEKAGGEAMAVAMDVASEASVIAAYDAAEQRFGTINSIVANAGTSVEGRFADLSVDDFDQLMNINVRGVFLTVREGGKRLIAAGSAQRQDGRIVLISSITADYIVPGLAAYSASKAAVRQMGKVVAREWVRQGINVNSILPGYVRTEINSEWFDSEAGQQHIATFPRKRLMSQDQLDAMLLYLCSDASSGVTGSSFTLDDGQSL